MNTLLSDDLARRVQRLESELRELQAADADRRASSAATAVAVQVGLFLLSLFGLVLAGVVWLR